MELLPKHQPLPEHLTFSLQVAGEHQNKQLLSVETLLPDDPRFADAQLVEYEVFKGEHYTEEESRSSLKEYSQYNQNSRFNVVCDGAGRILGVLREIRNTTDNTLNPDSTAYKTLDDFALDPQWKQYFDAVSPQSIIEVGTAAVPEEFRSPSLHVVDHLYHNLYVHAMAEGRVNLIASIDNRLLTLYKHYFNFQPIGPTIENYMGSDTTPVFSDVTLMADHLKSTSQQRYRRMILGDFSS